VESLSDAHVERAFIRGFDGMLRKELADLTNAAAAVAVSAEVPSTPRRTHRFEIAETIAMITPTGTRKGGGTTHRSRSNTCHQVSGAEYPRNAGRLDIWTAVAVSSDLRGP
jgi:hypothetical protein